MKTYITVVSVENNRVAKYQDFDTQAEADAHVATYGGFVTTSPNTGSMAYWIVDEEAQTLTHDSDTQTSDETTTSILRSISALEGNETPRRLAESVLSDAGKTWLTSNREKIAIERSKLKG